uniref:Mediator of DNA damage checkpoint protein 1 n=1 Tax=Oncorhynchus kisutch TaxID=8019 RepID=A0A8C7J0J0_ONCKI
MEATQLIDDSILEESEEEDDGEKRGEPLAKLRVLKNKHIAETELPLYQGENVLGRNPDSCSLPLVAGSVSKQHTIISISTFRGNHRHGNVAAMETEALVWDLGSMNGTRKGRTKLTPHVRYALTEGECVVIADIPCQYVSVDQRGGQGHMQNPTNAHSGRGSRSGSDRKAQLRGSPSGQGLGRETGTPKTEARGVNGEIGAPSLTELGGMGKNLAKPLSFEQTPTQPERTLVPESDSDGEQEGRRDKRGKYFVSDSDSHMSSPTCSTFLSPTTKVIPESQAERDRLTPSAPMVSTEDTFNMDSDTDVEGEEEMGLSAPVNAVKPPAATEPPTTDSDPGQIHMDSDTDVEEGDTMDDSATNVTSFVSDPEILLDSDTDEEDSPFTPPASSRTAELLNPPTSVGPAAAAPLEIRSDSDTDLEEDATQTMNLPPPNVTTVTEDAVLASRQAVLPSPTITTTTGSDLSEPSDFRMDSDTEEDGPGEAGQGQTACRLREGAAGPGLLPLGGSPGPHQKCSTPLASSVQEEMETQVFFCPSDPFRPALSCSASDSQEDDDFVVAETQSFVLEAQNQGHQSSLPVEPTLDATQPYGLEPSLGEDREEQPSRGSFQLGLSDSSHLHLQARDQASESTQAFSFPGGDSDLEATQTYGSGGGREEPGLGQRSAVFGRNRQVDFVLEATQAYGSGGGREEPGLGQRSIKECGKRRNRKDGEGEKRTGEKRRNRKDGEGEKRRNRKDGEREKRRNRKYEKRRNRKDGEREKRTGEREETERMEREKREETERMEREKREETERMERGKREETERMEREKREETERMEREKTEQEKRERLERERKEREEQERLQCERTKREKKERLEEEKERIERERKEIEERNRLEREEKEERNRLEREEKEERNKLEREEKEKQEQLERERVEKERIEGEQAEKQRSEKEKMEREEKRKQERELLKKKKEAKERKLKEKLESEKKEREKKEVEEKEKEIKERQAKEQGEKQAKKDDENELKTSRRGRRATTRRTVTVPPTTEPQPELNILSSTPEPVPASITRSRSNSSNSVSSERSSIDTLGSRGRGGRKTTSTTEPAPGPDDPTQSLSPSNRQSEQPPAHKPTARGRRGQNKTAKTNEPDPVVAVEETTPAQVTEDSPAPRGNGRGRGRAGQKDNTPESTTTTVLFTGVVDEEGGKVVSCLGGSLAKGVADMTHLVTDRVRRTVKFLCAVARGVPVVTTVWLDKCGKVGRFLPTDRYLVKDREQENKFSFCLEESLRTASTQPLLQGYEVHVTRSVLPEPAQMKDIIVCSGARFLSTMPSTQKAQAQTLVISCGEDWSLCAPALSASLPVLSAEFLLTGILQQRVDLVTHVLSAPKPRAQPGAKCQARGRKRM